MTHLWYVFCRTSWQQKRMTNARGYIDVDSETDDRFSKYKLGCANIGHALLLGRTVRTLASTLHWWERCPCQRRDWRTRSLKQAESGYIYTSALSKLPFPSVEGAASGPFCALSFSSNFANSCIATSSSGSSTCCTPLTSSI